jgi:glucosyl-dolichyl phosphate glucuronosyltransferase
MKLTVILCTYNRAPLLASVLKQLAGQRSPDGLAWDVLVVDNNSKDDTAAVAKRMVAERPDRFRYLFVGRQGKAWALNTSLDEVDAEVLAFTDDDVDIDEAWIHELSRPFANPDCVGAGGRILPLFNHGQPSWLSGPLPRELRGPLNEFDLGEEDQPLRRAPYGANMAFRRSVFERHGRFRTDLGPIGGELRKSEDVEFCSRVLDAGEPMVYLARALVRHPVEPVRLQRRYFVRWWYWHGRDMSISEGIPADIPTTFGVPRYVARQGLTAAARAVTSLDEKRRLAEVCRVAELCGRAAGALALRKAR